MGGQWKKEFSGTHKFWIDRPTYLVGRHIQWGEPANWGDSANRASLPRGEVTWGEMVMGRRCLLPPIYGYEVI